jgi:dTDP-4-amino-4,6-dideoxygalactose transaminase
MEKIENLSDLPALLGGAPLRPQGPPPWPLADPEIDEVLRQAYREGWWGKYQAGQCDRLEGALRDFHQVEHVLLCGSGNYAVELGLRALQVGPGDEVILSAYDYPGNFMSIHAVGAIPVLVDVEPRGWNLCLEAVRQAIGPRTKAILASHLHGGRINMRALYELAQEKGLLILEDAAQATGAQVDGRTAGIWGDAGVLSFGGSKLLSAGRGGALLTNRADVAQRARNILVRAGNIVCPLSELQAALLLPQLAKLKERNDCRWRNVQSLCKLMADIPGVRLFVNADDDKQPAFFKLGIQLDAAAFGIMREIVIKALKAEGFAVDEGFAAAHFTRSPKRFRQGSALSEAERAHCGCIGLQHPILLEPSAMAEFAYAWRRLHAARSKFAQ